MQRAYFAPGADPAAQQSLAQKLGEAEQQLDDRQKQFNRTGC